jgi:DNA-binding NtrC family response regulator
MEQLNSNCAIGVLIVEDETLIRMNACEFVEEAGFKAYGAENAEEAIRILESNEDIRLVFTDVNMPGSMDGLQLANYVNKRWPPVKLIIVSGRIAPRADEMPSGSIFLGKPYHIDEIADRVRAMIAA